VKAMPHDRSLTPEGLLEFIAPYLHACGAIARLAQPGVVTQIKKSALSSEPTSIHSALTDVDVLIQQTIEFALAEYRHEVIVIGEEATPYNQEEPWKGGSPDHLRCSLDPLDGTFGYTCGSPDYCTMMSCFDERQFHWGAIHFPGSGRLILSQTKLPGQFQELDAPEGKKDAFLERPFQWRDVQPLPGNRLKLAVHYRLLMEPFLPAAEALMARGYGFLTLEGEPKVDWCSPLKTGSNGALLAEVLAGNACAYVAPFTAFHDIAPLVSFFPPEGCRFYSPEGHAREWRPVPLETVLQQAARARGLRCRVILAPDIATLNHLEACLNERP